MNIFDDYMRTLNGHLYISCFIMDMISESYIFVIRHLLDKLC